MIQSLKLTTVFNIPNFLASHVIDCLSTNWGQHHQIPKENLQFFSFGLDLMILHCLPFSLIIPYIKLARIWFPNEWVHLLLWVFHQFWFFREGWRSLILQVWRIQLFSNSLELQFSTFLCVSLEKCWCCTVPLSCLLVKQTKFGWLKKPFRLISYLGH